MLIISEIKFLRISNRVYILKLIRNNRNFLKVEKICKDRNYLEYLKNKRETIFCFLGKSYDYKNVYKNKNKKRKIK